MPARIAILALAIASTLHGGAAAARPGPRPSRIKGPIHVVQPGETLWSIARQDYGRTEDWEAIYKLNREAIGPDPRHVCAGTVLHLPSARALSTAPRPRKPAQARPTRKAATSSRNPFDFVGRTVPPRPAPVTSLGRDPFEFGQ